MNRTRIFLGFVLTVSLLASSIPLAVKSQQAPNTQSLSALIGLLREAAALGDGSTRERIGKARQAVEEANKQIQKGGDGRLALERAREVLRIIEWRPANAGDGREKISQALRILDQSLSSPGASGESNNERPSGNVTTESGSGLLTLNFRTGNGNLRLNLPDDVTAGDTISGSVVAEPAGQSKEEVAKNEAELSGYVIDVEKKETKPDQPLTNFNVPPTVATIPVVLKDKSGNVVDRAEIPVNTPMDQGPPADSKQPGIPTGQADLVKIHNNDLQLPTLGQAGRPIEVRGPFDGNLTTTIVKVGGKATRILAESPRKAIAQSPGGIIGPTEIEVEKNGLTKKGTFHNVSVKLSAPQLQLLKGQQTTLSIAVNGLAGFQGDVPLQIENRTPNVISMEGGDRQLVNISPAELSAGGDYVTKRVLTGIQTGGFNINAMVRARFPFDQGDRGDGRGRPDVARTAQPTSTPAERSGSPPSCERWDFTPDVELHFLDEDFTSRRLRVPANFHTAALNDQYGPLGVYFGGDRDH